MGLIPGTGTATGNIGVTAAFASTTLATMIFFGMKVQGRLRLAQFGAGAVFLNPIDFCVFCLFVVIEFMVRSSLTALAIRLFATMFGGHTVLLAFASLGFILHAAEAASIITLPLGALGILISIAIYLLELLVAFLQAYVFTLLTAVFIGASMEAEH